MKASLLVGLLLLCAVAVAGPARHRVALRGPQTTLEFDLAAGPWTRNAEPVEVPVLGGGPDDAAVVLSFDELGTRWSTTFATEQPTTWRLSIDWQLGEQGLLIEIMIDGEPLPPLRDLWRPTARPQHADLGPRWLGAGEHLLEFIAREAVDDGTLPVQRLTLQRP